MSEKTEAIAAKTAYTVSAGTVGMGVISLQDWAIIVGIIATIVTTIGSLYFKRKHYQLAVEQAALARAYHDGQSEEHHRCT